MLNKLNLKYRVKKLTIDNIEPKERLNISKKAMQELLENFKYMTDYELAFFIKENYLKQKILDKEYLSKEALDNLMQMLDIDIKYNIYKISSKSIKIFKSDESDKLYGKYVIDDKKHNSKVYVFVYSKNQTQSDIYICNYGFIVDQFE